MTLIPVSVECYSGSKASERPRRILAGATVYEVIRATAFSVQEDVASRHRRYRFEVLTEDGSQLILIRDGDHWFLET
jgi:hypothetical protein